MVPLVVESWIWWSLVIVIAGLRFVSRRISLGAFIKFQLDDYLMLLVLCFYTTLIVSINIVAMSNSNLLPPGFDVNALTPADISDRVYGSKLVLVVEQCQCATIWGAKGCLIIMYLRLTCFRKENIAIKCLAAYVGISYVVMEILYFAVWCRPFYEYWAVPTNSTQCDAATNHLITNAVFNLSSDCIMIIIGLPMFLRLQLPWQKKLPLILIFSLGIFVILAAVLNKVYSFSNPYGILWSYWYVRESSTALLVANLPFTWPIFRRATGLKSQLGDSAQNMLTSLNASGTTNLQSQTSRSNRRGTKLATLSTSGTSRTTSEQTTTPTNPSAAAAGRRASTQSAEEKGLTLEQILGQPMNSSVESFADPYTHPLRFKQLAMARERAEDGGGVEEVEVPEERSA